jgi:diadenosine tetraphosphate (Ap4A) HIT family hydrolase
MRCIFCESPEIKERGMIAENTLARAFLTNIPIVPGHTLVVPKRCVASFDAMSREEQNAVMDLRTVVADALRKGMNAQGFNYAWNDGEVAGQSVPHFHLHVVPRTVGDEGISEYEPRKFLYRPGSRMKSPEEELQQVTAFVRKYVGK